MNSENTEHKQRSAIQGIFSSQEVRKVGTGTTTRKSIQKTYWNALELPDGTVEVQPLNINYIPSGPKRAVPLEDFLRTFSPEPEFYVSNVFPKIKEINKTIARADRYRNNKEYYSAEMEYANALRVDEENVRANFGLGITYLERGEKAKAEDILARVVKLDGAFEAEHKHLFNDFGINLRKNGMYTQALAYYTRAVELAAYDENLYYNMARAYLDNKEPEKTVDCLLTGLNINPLQETLLKFLLWLLTKNMVPEEKKSAVAAMLQHAKKARQEQEQQAQASGAEKTVEEQAAQTTAAQNVQDNSQTK